MKTNMKLSRRIALGGLLIALSVMLPQAIHLFGAADLGRALLPMHIPVMLSGYALGPFLGLIVGAVSPILSSLLTNMPPFERLGFMVLELAAYGFMSGLLYKTLNLRRFRFGVILSLVCAMIFGRLVYALSLFVAADLLDIAKVGPIAAWEAVTAGIIGIVIQIVFIPAMVYLLQKLRVIDNFDSAQKDS